MKQQQDNIVLNQIYEAVVSYNPNLFYEKSKHDVIIAGLRVYEIVPGCKSVSLFLFEEEESSFALKTTTANEPEDELIKLYQKLVDEGAVAEALNRADLISCKLNGYENCGGHFLIIPLYILKGISGLILLCLDNPYAAEEEITRLYKMHSNYFALLINNYDLSNELESLKEVTEQRIALRTKEISQSSRELRRILDSVQTGILIIDKLSNEISDTNLAAADMIGSVRERLIGLRKEDILQETTDENETQNAAINKEGWLKKEKGSDIPVLYTLMEITLGLQEFYLLSFIDISERKKMEEALQQAHDELEMRVEERTIELSEANNKYVQQIMENLAAEEERLKLYWAVHQSPASIIITNLKGNIEYVNPRFTELTGYELEEVKGQNPRLLKSGDLSTDKYEELWKIISSGDIWHGEFRNKKKNGNLFWVSASISAIKNPHGEIAHYLGVQEDITFKKNAEQELIEAKTRAEESDKLKSTLLANMSHEFRTPLIGILGFSQFLMNEIKEPEHVEMITDISTSGKRLLNTLDGVLYLSQLETISSTLKLLKSDIAYHLREIVLPFILKVKEVGLGLFLEISNYELYANIDTDLFRKSLNNLIDNAIKYTPEGKITIILDTRTKEEVEWITISIKDTGIGIDEDDQKIIFEAFRQASEGYSRDYEGCGLGLTLTQKMVELMKGHITVESVPSEGSTFTIWLPKS